MASFSPRTQTWPDIQPDTLCPGCRYARCDLAGVAMARERLSVWDTDLRALSVKKTPKCEYAPADEVASWFKSFDASRHTHIVADNNRAVIVADTADEADHTLARLQEVDTNSHQWSLDNAHTPDGDEPLFACTGTLSIRQPLVAPFVWDGAEYASLERAWAAANTTPARRAQFAMGGAHGDPDSPVGVPGADALPCANATTFWADGLLHMFTHREHAHFCATLLGTRTFRLYYPGAAGHVSEWFAVPCTEIWGNLVGENKLARIAEAIRTDAWQEGLTRDLVLRRVSMQQSAM